MWDDYLFIFYCIILTMFRVSLSNTHGWTSKNFPTLRLLRLLVLLPVSPLERAERQPQAILSTVFANRQNSTNNGHPSSEKHGNWPRRTSTTRSAFLLQEVQQWCLIVSWTKIWLQIGVDVNLYCSKPYWIHFFTKLWSKRVKQWNFPWHRGMANLVQW